MIRVREEGRQGPAQCEMLGLKIPGLEKIMKISNSVPLTLLGLAMCG